MAWNRLDADNLLFGLSTMTLCLLLRTLLFISVIRYYVRHGRLLSHPSFWSSLAVIKGVMLLLVIGNRRRDGEEQIRPGVS